MVGLTAAFSIASEEYCVSVLIDRDLDLIANVRVRRGSTIFTVKSELACSVPQGSARTHDIALKKCIEGSGAAVAPQLADEEVITEELLRLELCPVAEGQAQTDSVQDKDSMNYMCQSNNYSTGEESLKRAGGYAACRSAELPVVGSKLCVHVPSISAPGRKRQVLVARVGEAEIVALDNTCFHANGPLDQGDIEDVEGRSCIVCPVHFFQFDLRTGEFISEGHEEPMKAQRTHRAWESKGYVFVELDDSRLEVPSDAYAENDDFEDSDEDNTSLNFVHPDHHTARDSMEHFLPTGCDDVD